MAASGSGAERAVARAPLTRRAECLFEHLKRVKKATPKVESEADLDGFALLEPADQARLRELVSRARTAALPRRVLMRPQIARRNEPKKKLPKKPKAAAASSPVSASSPASATAAPPPPRFVVRLEPVDGTAPPDEAAHKPVVLASGANELGRGARCGVTAKLVSRQQLNLTVDAEQRTLVLVRNGTNPSRVYRLGREPIDANRGQMCTIGASILAEIARSRAAGAQTCSTTAIAFRSSASCGSTRSRLKAARRRKRRVRRCRARQSRSSTRRRSPPLSPRWA